MIAEQTLITALTSSPSVINALAHGTKSIYKQTAPDTGSYPYLVVKTLNDDPKLYSDDRAYIHATVIRIVIVTDNGVYDTLATNIRIGLQAAGFTWSGDTFFEELKEKDRILEFIYEEKI